LGGERPGAFGKPFDLKETRRYHGLRRNLRGSEENPRTGWRQGDGVRGVGMKADAN